MLIRALCIFYLSLCCVGTLWLSYYGARTLRSAGSNAFIFFMMSILVYMFGYVCELSSDTFESIYLSLRIEYLGVPVISVFWVLFALGYNGYAPRKKKFVYPALFLLPVVTTVMLYTNMHHFLHYKSLVVDTRGPFPVAVNVKGTWYYIDFVYKTLLNFSGAALFGRAALRATGYRRRQTAIIFCGSLIPLAGNLLGVLGFAPYGLDINPFLLSITLPLCSYAIFRLRMFDIVPIARDRVFKTMNISVVVLDSKGRIVDCNDCARRILPRLDQNAPGMGLRDVLPVDAEGLEPEALLSGGDRELAFPVDGRTRWFAVSGAAIPSPKGKPVGLIVSLRDVTENKALLRRLERMAAIDALTEVYGRRFFMESCLVEIRRAWREKSALSFLLTDIDHFKNVNDTHGHLAGDLVLKNVAAAFRRVLRDGDVLGRYGGEEFAIVLPRTDQEGARALAERLRREVASTATVYEGTAIETTISVGIAAIAPGHWGERMDYERTREALIKASDQALYRAKDQGRNRVCLTRLD